MIVPLILYFPFDDELMSPRKDNGGHDSWLILILVKIARCSYGEENGLLIELYY